MSVYIKQEPGMVEQGREVGPDRGQSILDRGHSILDPKSKFDLTGQENCQRIRKYANGKTYIQYTRIHCTTCSRHLGSAVINFREVFIHPLLKVLICKDCADFYQSGDVVQDDDGTERYCSWCGQGGTLVCCTKCPKVFCETCIRNNFNQTKFLEITSNDSWKCFSCDFSQISALRIHCFEFREYCIIQQMDTNTEKINPLAKFIDYSTCCVSNYKPSKGKRSDKSSAEFIHHTNLKVIRLTPSESSSTNTKRSHDIQKYGENEAAMPSRISVPKLVWKEGTCTKIYDSFNTDGNFFSKPFSFVGLPATDVHSNFLSEVPKLEPILSATPMRFVAKPRCQFSSELLPGQHFLYKENQQTSCQVKVTKSRDFIEGRTKLIDKAIRETALVNSTFASAILQLSQMNTSAESLNEHITIYNSLQECLSTSIASLEQIRGQLTGNNSSISNNELETNRVPQTFKIMRYPF